MASRATPFNARKRSALFCIVEANNWCRFVTSTLRKPSAEIETADIDRTLISLRRAQERLAQAESFIAGMKDARR